MQFPLRAGPSKAPSREASVKPLAEPSSATSSNGTFCATVIIACWSLAFGPRLTSQTLLPGVCLAKFAASNSAWPAHGSRTAGSIISFFNAGPVGEATGSSVYSGSGTMLPQTTIGGAVLINQVARKKTTILLTPSQSLFGQLFQAGIIPINRSAIFLI